MTSSRIVAVLTLALSGVALAGPPKAGGKVKPPPAAKAPGASSCFADAPSKNPASFELDGKAMPVPVVTLVPAQKNGDGSVVSFRLRFADKDFGSSLRVSMNLALQPGQVFEGRTFAQLPGVDMKDQPDVITDGATHWSPRLYAVDVVVEELELSYGQGVESAVRVVFGKRTGDTVAGTVQFCIEPGQADGFFQKTPTRRVRLNGTFEVDVSELKTP